MAKKIADSTYYDILVVDPEATDLEIKKAYRKLAIKYHPDKNPDDPTAAAKFQELSAAYQVLSTPARRQHYDEFGLESINGGGPGGDPSAMEMQDAAEMFTMIFGGNAFVDLIGEISLFSDMTKMMVEQEMQETENSEVVDISQLRITDGTNNNNNGTLSDKKSGKKGKDTKKKDGKMAQANRIMEERQKSHAIQVANLEKSLINKISVWTETDKTAAVTESFKEKIRLEANDLKMESFGIEILHSIGSTYLLKAGTVLKSQKLFGLGGIGSKFKEKGAVVKESWNAITTIIDAQSSALKAEESKKRLENERISATIKAEEENNSASFETTGIGSAGSGAKSIPLSQAELDALAAEQAEMERTLMGKMLAAAWSGSKLEIQTKLREVCDNVLHDKSVPSRKRLERAEALKIIGRIYKDTVRSAEEQEEVQVFEELFYEAKQKPKKANKKK
jgi:curved DNA-binding protein CbpA